MVGRISRDELKAGDHIYTWRLVYGYAHHGIYIGEDTVIHYTRQTETARDKIPLSSGRKYEKNRCVKCGYKPKSSSKNIVSSCLDCFLAGDKLYLFKYDVTWFKLASRIRGGTCTTAPSDSPQEVVRRAKYLLEHDGFGDYHLRKNNCEDFAIYCKTELLVDKKIFMGGSGQVNTVAAFILGFDLTARTLMRLFGDLGIRPDAVVMPVETLVDNNLKKKKERRS